VCACYLFLPLLFISLNLWGAIFITSSIRIRLGFSHLVIEKMSSTKYEVKKFYGEENFSLWRRQMKDLLIQQIVHKALLGKE
jgi:hypothetical protein